MRTNNIIITIDYETWHPIPEGYDINWKEDLIDNTYCLMDVCDRVGVKLTLMVEMCEFIWLKENGETEICSLIEQQLKDAIRRGHDVQLHMHPNWLPELGAKYEKGQWKWNWNYASCEDYPYDLNELFFRCKKELENIVQEIKPNYRVCAFRAGAYRVQPFDRISKALIINGIICDTSVYFGGKSAERGYNFSKCKHQNRPYWASTKDPQNADISNKNIIELPITVWKKNARWFLDNSEAKIFASRFLKLNYKYFKSKENYFVLIGHSKGKHDFESIEQQLWILKKYPGVKFTTISNIVSKMEKELKTKEVNNAEQSLDEIEKIMKYIYDIIEPGGGDNGGIIEEILRQGKTLCYGYAVLLYTVLKQYGYCVNRITLVAKNMPKGRGKRKIDSHEVVELRLRGKKYILDATTNRIIPYGLRDILKKPDLIKERKNKDKRYIERNYTCYDSAFFYERVVYYTKKNIYVYNIEGERIISKLKNIFINIITYIIPSNMRIYNFYRVYNQKSLFYRRS